MALVLSAPCLLLGFACCCGIQVITQSPSTALGVHMSGWVHPVSWHGRATGGEFKALGPFKIQRNKP